MKPVRTPEKDRPGFQRRRGFMGRAHRPGTACAARICVSQKLGLVRAGNKSRSPVSNLTCWRDRHRVDRLRRNSAKKLAISTETEDPFLFFLELCPLSVPPRRLVEQQYGCNGRCSATARSRGADARRYRGGGAVVLTLKWDQRFESAFLQRRVCKPSVPREIRAVVLTPNGTSGSNPVSSSRESGELR
jgi:hypothetical protein